MSVSRVGTAAVNGIVTERSYKAHVATMGDTSVFLMIYINLQATLAMPLSLLTRAPQIAMEILSRRVRKPEICVVLRGALYHSVDDLVVSVESRPASERRRATRATVVR